MTEPSIAMLSLNAWEDYGEPPDDVGLAAMVELRDATEDMRLHARLQQAIDAWQRNHTPSSATSNLESFKEESTPDWSNVWPMNSRRRGFRERNQ